VSAPKVIRRHVVVTVLALLFVGGCETTSNVEKGFDPASSASTGFVVFTVTHDRGEGLKTGANLKFFVNSRDVERGTPQARSFSNMEALSPLMTSEIEGTWGRIYVRQLAVGRYGFTDWELVQETGVGRRILTPRVRAAPLAFDVKQSQVIYLGCIHANVVWGSNVFGVPLAAGAVPEVRDEYARDVAIAIKNYPQLQGKVTRALLPLGAWSAD
jgi:hypothetical protein